MSVEESTRPESSPVAPSEGALENEVESIRRTRSSEADDILTTLLNGTATDNVLPNNAHKRTYSDGSALQQIVLGMQSNIGHKRTYSTECGIDTAAPIESVKEAVSKFGGIVDWRAHKKKNEEKSKSLENQLEKAKEEISKLQEESEAAKDATDKALNELESTKSLIEELMLDLEKAQTEEQEAKKDSELAKLNVEEVQQGIANDASVAAQARHAAAVAELNSLKDELEKMRSEYSSLNAEKDLAVKRAEEAASASMELEKTVEELSLELLVIKEALESAHAEHLEAEEQSLRVDMENAQVTSNCEKELKQAEEELQRLNQQYQPENDIQLKLDQATTFLSNLKAELEAYNKIKLNKEKCEEEDTNQSGSEEEIASYKRELEEVRLKVEKATADITYLKVASASLVSELEIEKSALSAIKNKEGMACITVASLESELTKIMSELELVNMEKDGTEKLMEVPNELTRAKQEMEQSTSLATLAHEEMLKAKSDAELTKASAYTIDRRIEAAQKEIEASRASERLALAAVKALEQSELLGNSDDKDAPKGVTLSMEEYQALSKKALDVEEKSKLKVGVAISQLEEAKESELKNMESLEAVNKEKAAKKEELRMAVEKAIEAEGRKLSTEQELRKRRTENEQRRRASDVGIAIKPIESPTSINEDTKRFERSSTAPVQTSPEDLTQSDSSSESGGSKKKKKKRSLFPRIVMFLARRKVQAPKKTMTI